MEGDASKEGYLIKNKQSLDERTKTEVDGIVRLLSLEKGSEILDCPCGYGRHSIGLARRGFIMTGSDINSVHLQEAIEDTRKNFLKITFNKENMIDLKYISEFDAVINMFISFGFFETDEENEKVLKNFYNALRPGGKFLMHTDVNVPRILAGKYKENEERSLVAGKTLRIIDSYSPETKRVNGIWIIKDGDREKKKNYSIRVYTREEFEEMCKKIGFSSVATYSDWDGAGYSEDAEVMIMVAMK